ncbi:MAG TPA: hypothetical protein VGN83_07475 [Falsiroseomonas sp.]|jgi:hypothetical protein|nr:hypothetical protein [Falsiroseomonas sp.]
MRLTVSLPLVEAVKTELRISLPDVKSSHRVEALARGLGWATNAALRAALAVEPSDRIADPGAFHAYLAERSVAVPARALFDGILRAQVRAVMGSNDRLTRHGFGVYDEGRISVAEWRTRFAASRAEMLEPAALGEFERACEFLSRLSRTQAPTKVLSTYNLKHSAERWHRHRGIEGRWDREYVSNGMLLAAAYHLGFHVRRASPTAFTGHLNVSTTSVRTLENERKPLLPPPEPGEPFRVLGRVHPTELRARYGYLAAGEAKPVLLSPAAHTPRNLLRLAPVDWWVSRFPPRSRRAPFDTLAAMGHLFSRASEVGFFEPTAFR